MERSPGARNAGERLVGLVQHDLVDQSVCSFLSKKKVTLLLQLSCNSFISKNLKKKLVFDN
jgi:hypothetical protein